MTVQIYVREDLDTEKILVVSKKFEFFETTEIQNTHTSRLQSDSVSSRPHTHIIVHTPYIYILIQLTFIGCINKKRYTIIINIYKEKI